MDKLIRILLIMAAAMPTPNQKIAIRSALKSGAISNNRFIHATFSNKGRATTNLCRFIFRGA